MIKILFLIHDLGQGGAEKVLVNLVNNMDPEQFNITVIALFGGGVNEQFLKKSIRYKTVFRKSIPGNSHWMKLLTPAQLHALIVKEHYDVEVAYLEGPSARVVSGCKDQNTTLISWIHSNCFSEHEFARSFKNLNEAKKCYKQFDTIVCVSQFVRDNFCKWMPDAKECIVLYNTVESRRILEQAEEAAYELADNGRIRICTVGTMKPVKGYDRLLRVANRLKSSGCLFDLYFLGTGPQEAELKKYAETSLLADSVHFLGYQVNPYKYVSKCDLYVCSSFSEGFSTAVTEALIVGTAVCSVDVSGMKEMLGNHNEYGVVTENSEDALYNALRELLTNQKLLEHYKEQSKNRAKHFCTEDTVKAAENLFLK